jgi:hypothetical protein
MTSVKTGALARDLPAPSASACSDSDAGDKMVTDG